jgi:quercetin dioxygenase-like cupin family protein
MILIDHEGQLKEEWRAGVLTRMLVSSQNGSAQMTLFEQWCAPGCGAPLHRHAVEEILTITFGLAELWVDAERSLVSGGQSVVIPAGIPHRFSNAGTDELRVQAILAAPIFEAQYEDMREASRRWGPVRP